MDERQDSESLLAIVDGVDHALALHDDLADVLDVGFGHLAPGTGQVLEVGDRLKDAIDEPLRVDA